MLSLMPCRLLQGASLFDFTHRLQNTIDNSGRKSFKVVQVSLNLKMGKSVAISDEHQVRRDGIPLDAAC